jgi:hypothetical protein
MSWSNCLRLLSALWNDNAGISGALPPARRRRGRKARAPRVAQHEAWVVETLEGRLLLSATAATTFILSNQHSSGVKPNATAGVAPIDPAQMQAAYGVNAISFGGTTGTGAGQTIAIVDAYNDPDILSDANSFSSEFGLPQFNSTGNPTLKVLNETGGTSLPANSTPGTWDVEESLDVEWAHSIAPDANIILFEANSNSYSDLFTAVKTAADYANVSVVSMSWGGGEFSGENSYDSDFVTPSGHQGVTFLAATGDSGTPSEYPAFSPNVVAVGGTSLDINTSGTYLTESGWDDASGAGGGGISQLESQPSYQVGKVNGTSSTMRTVPDVSMDADPDTGVYVLDSDDGGWYQVGGTSLATPMWAGLVAIADQGRALDSQSTLTSAQTLSSLYSLPSSDFHDITTGSNGTYAATTGYDLATGIGSPVANLLVPALAGYTTTTTSTPPGISGPSTIDVNEDSTLLFSTANGDAITLSDAAAGSSTLDTLTLNVNSGSLALGSTSGLSSFSGNNSGSITVTGTLASLNVALNGLVYTPPTGTSGSASLQLSLSDPGDGLKGPGSVAITVSPFVQPTITIPSTISVNENSPLVFSTAKGTGITFTDSFAGSTPETLTLSATDGILTLFTTSNLTFDQNTTNGSSSIVVTGTLAELNAAVNGLTYTPGSNFVGTDTLKASLLDTGTNLTGNGSSTISVNSPSQPPTVTAPATESVSDSSSLVFSTAKGDAIDGTDPEAGSTTEEIVLTATHGTLKLATTSGVKVVSGANKSASMTISGTLASLNAALNGLTFTPTSRFSGAATISVSLKDSGDGLSGSGAVNVTVSQAGRAVDRAEATPTANSGQGTSEEGTPKQTSAESHSTILTINVTSDGITVDESTPATSGPVTMPAAASESSLPTNAAKGTGNENRLDGSTSQNAGGIDQNSAGAQDSSLIDEAFKWLGLSAAVEFLNS